MNELLAKYNTLSPQGKQEVNDFLDFILSKNQNKPSFDMKSWKEKIKNISTWTEEDIKAYDENSQLFNQWKTEEW